MSKTFQPDSLHPYIMDARLKKATGSGGISGVAYSTTEHKTGRKWLDGKDIYEKTYTNIALLDTGTTDIDTLSGIDNVIVLYGTAENNASTLNIRPIPFAAGGNNDIRLDVTTNVLKVITFGAWSSYTANVTIQYTKSN